MLLVTVVTFQAQTEDTANFDTILASLQNLAHELEKDFDTPPKQDTSLGAHSN